MEIITSTPLLPENKTSHSPQIPKAPGGPAIPGRWRHLTCITDGSVYEIKKDNNDQESIQLSTTPVPGYQMGK